MFRAIGEINAHSAAIYTLDVHDNYLYTGSGDRFVARWDISAKTQDKFTIKAENAVYSLAVIPSHHQLVFGCSNGDVHVISSAAKKEIKFLTQHKTAVFSIYYDAELQRCYIGDADGTLSIWSIPDWKLLLYLPFECGKIRRIQRIDEFIALACQDGNIRMLDAKRCTEMYQFFAHKDGVFFVNAFPTRRNLLISGGKDGYLRIWDSSSYQEIVALPAHNFAIYDCAFTPNGEQFITVSRDKSIKIWNAQNLSVLQKLERKHYGHSHAVNGIKMLTNGEFITVGDDKRIIFWGNEH